MATKKLFENFHWPLFWTTISLVIIGLLNLYSALYVWGEGVQLSLFWNQLVSVILGLLLLLVFGLVDYRLWERFTLQIYGSAIFLLVLVLVVGRTVSGHTSWIEFGPIHLQPSEVAKLGLAVALAKYFSDRPTLWGFSFRPLFKPILLMLLPVGLVIMEKDLGSSLFYPLIFLTVALVAKIQRKTLLLFLLLITVTGSLTYSFGLKPYQKARVLNFLNPEADPKKSGYHLLQSKIAVGSGEILGKGYLKGKINKLRYLPDKHTDFIFAVLAEEWGFLGAGICIGLYGFLIWSGLQIGARARDTFGCYLAVGIVAIFFWHLFINVGGMLGVIPLTGVPLPFLSYGGTATIMFLSGVGILMNIHSKRFLF